MSQQEAEAEERKKERKAKRKQPTTVPQLAHFEALPPIDRLAARCTVTVSDPTTYLDTKL